jgi:hypothetical protein
MVPASDTGVLRHPGTDLDSVPSCMPDRETVRRFREEAERCRQLAGQIADPEIAEKLMRIAEVYETIASRSASMLSPDGC